ncbi:hypothetical protein KAI87_12980 [Myxococcota bacterium]|nr:hypothetical protein [Myxococcota bacterium]
MKLTQLIITIVAISLAACGSDTAAPTWDESLASQSTTTSNPSAFKAEHHTPGFFRDLYRMLSAQAVLDDATAVERLIIEIPARIREPGAMPSMLDEDLQTLQGLMILSTRSLQATSDNALVARHLGELLLQKVLALDPARLAWNNTHSGVEQVEYVTGGGEILAEEAIRVIKQAAFQAPLECSSHSVSNTNFNAGSENIVWVDEICEDDRYVGDYCENDEWIPGECYDRWITEDCTGGYYEDNGYYEYRCYGSDYDDCIYEWVARWDYVDGECNGGYYEEDCYPGTWEEGLCYEGSYVPGYCIPGHYEESYPNGLWSFPEVQSPPACAQVRPSQYAIAKSALLVMKDKGYSALDAQWKGALDELIASDDKMNNPDESLLDATYQILESATIH